MPKPNKKTIEEYKKAVKFGCVVCKKIYGVYTEPCIHHLTGAGMGLKSRLFIPLCHHHHQGKEGIHFLGTFTWEEKFGTQEQLLEYYKKNESGTT
mgnify:FL=1|tara:strand:+ start:109 stop:393 length:285 start_codon:yes stop_codon:yes gene_type:complete